MTDATDIAAGPVLIAVNAASQEEAAMIGERLVAGRLAASVNIIPGVLSIYRWRGETSRRHEATMLVKTIRSRVAPAVALIEQLHSYEVPAVLVLPVEGGCQAYLDWLASQCREDFRGA